MKLTKPDAGLGKKPHYLGQHERARSLGAPSGLGGVLHDSGNAGSFGRKQHLKHGSKQGVADRDLLAFPGTESRESPKLLEGPEGPWASTPFEGLHSRFRTEALQEQTQRS